MFHFQHPELLWLLLVLPLLALAKGRRGPASALKFSSTQSAGLLAQASRSRAGAWLLAFRILTVGLLITALARPQIVHGTSEVEASGIDIMLAVDASGSMEAMDFTRDGQPADRLDVVKDVVARFIEQRPNDRIGLIAFAGRPYLASPPTLDHDWLLQRLEAVRTGLVEDGTAIGSAIASSVNRLRNQTAKSKIVILLTDGMNNAGKASPLTAAEAAEALGIKIYTIGAGSRGRVPVPVTDSFGQRRMAMAQVDIDEETLKQVSEKTGARYFRATDTHSLEKIYDEINRLETTTMKIRNYEHASELFPIFALAGLLVFGLESLLGQTRFRRLP